MFTGLVEGTGRVVARDDMAGGMRLHVATPLAASAAIGDSIAHNGVCLTVVDRDHDAIATEVGPGDDARHQPRRASSSATS